MLEMFLLISISVVPSIQLLKSGHTGENGWMKMFIFVREYNVFEHEKS